MKQNTPCQMSHLSHQVSQNFPFQRIVTAGMKRTKAWLLVCQMLPGRSDACYCKEGGSQGEPEVWFLSDYLKHSSFLHRK